MKRHERFRISGRLRLPVKYHNLYHRFFHLTGEASPKWALASGVKRPARTAPGRVAGGEFDWGGTPVKPLI